MTPEEIEFESAVTVERATDEPALVVDVEGFEGPLDLLLMLARQQKVDLAKISILALADQYPPVHRGGATTAARARRRLPGDGGMARLSQVAPAAAGHQCAGGPERRGHGECAGLAAASGSRRSAASRSACSARPQLDRDVFGRGQPEPIAHIKRPQWTATLYDLLSAYAQQRQRKALSHLRFAKRTVWSLAEAREVLERLIGQSADWTRLDQFLIAYVVEPSLAPTVFASSFASTLEMVREGLAEIHQLEAFAPLYVRKRSSERGGKSVQRRPEAAGEISN